LAADMDEKDSVIKMLNFELDSLKKDHKLLVAMHGELKDTRKGNSVAVQTEKVADYNHIAIELAIASYITIYVCMNLAKVGFHTHYSKVHALLIVLQMNYYITIHVCATTNSYCHIWKFFECI